MALVTRYFSTSANGAGDGTTWNDRAALFSGGVWSSIITGFDFGGSDALICMIGPGTYSITSGLAAGTFSVAQPTNKNTLTFHGCDSSGNPLTPPDPKWQSCEPNWDTSSLPLLDRGSGGSLSVITWLNCRLIAWAGTHNGAVLATSGIVDWCYGTLTGTSGTSGYAISASLRISNSIFETTATNYLAVVGAYDVISNVRVIGNPSASGGNRDGLRLTGFSAQRASRVTVFGNPGKGVMSSATNAAFWIFLFQSVLADNSGDGVEGIATSSQTSISQIDKCMITGNGGYGIDGQSETVIFTTNNRLRDNTSGNFGGMLNVATDWDNYTTDSDDASEYVDGDNATLALRDYTIKSGSAIHGKGYGVADQVVAGGGTPVTFGFL